MGMNDCVTSDHRITVYAAPLQGKFPGGKVDRKCRGFIEMSFFINLSLRLLALFLAKIGGMGKAFPISGSLDKMCQCFMIICLIDWLIGENVVDMIIGCFF